MSSKASTAMVPPFNTVFRYSAMSGYSSESLVSTTTVLATNGQTEIDNTTSRSKFQTE